MYSVLLLIASFGALAGLYVLLDAPFIAVTQIIIYAGAIMVLFLFVVMLLNVPREEPAPVTAVGAARADGLQARRGAVGAARRSSWSGRCRGWASAGSRRTPRRRPVSSVARIGSALFTEYAFAFEATSILILVAMVGAVVLARRER